MVFLESKGINLNSHQKTHQSRAAKPDPYTQVAEGFESQFARILLDRMRKTVDHANPKTSAAKIYESMLDEKIAESIAKNGELGIKRAVLDQIKPKQMPYKNSAIQRYQGSDQ